MFIPCGRVSWLPVSFLLHLKYTLSYHIVSYTCINAKCALPSRFDRLNQSDPGFKSRFLGFIWNRTFAGSLPECNGFFPCRRQSFRGFARIARLMTVSEMLTDLLNVLFWNGKENEKVICNPHQIPDHHQTLIDSSGWYICPVTTVRFVGGGNDGQIKLRNVQDRIGH